MRPVTLYWRLSLFYLFYFALLGAWVPYWSLYLKSIGFDARAIGYLSGIMMATRLGAPNAWSWLAERSGRRLTIIRIGSFLAVAAFSAIFIDHGFWMLAAVVAGYSFFWNAILPQFEVITLSHLAGRYQYYSRIRVWGSIGFIIAVIGLGEWFDRAALATLPLALTAVLTMIWLATLAVPAAEASTAPCEPTGSFGAILRQRPVIAFLAAAFLLQASHGPYYTFYSVYLSDHGYSKALIGQLWALGVVAEVVIFLVMHRLLDRFSLRQIILASLALASLRWMAIGTFPDERWVIAAAQLLHAASFGTFHASAVEFIRRYFRGGHQGHGQALYSSFGFGAGVASGSVLSGFIWDYAPAMTFYTAAGACILASLVVAVGMNRGPALSTSRQTALA